MWWLIEILGRCCGLICRLGQPLHPGDPQGDRHHPAPQSRSLTWVDYIVVNCQARWENTLQCLRLTWFVPVFRSGDWASWVWSDGAQYPAQWDWHWWGLRHSQQEHQLLQRWLLYFVEFYRFYTIDNIDIRSDPHKKYIADIEEDAR